MENGIFVQRQTSGQNSWRRSPVQEPHQLLVNAYGLDPNQHWETLLYIYNRMRGRGMTSLFWDRGPEYQMSFPEFVNFHTPAQGRILFAVMHEPPGGPNTLIGAMGLADFVGTFRAAVSFWLEPRYRGVNSLQFGKQLLTFCHANLDLENVYALSPWRHAQEFCRRIGFSEVAEIPHFCKWGERLMDVSVFHSEREYWKQQMIATMRMSGFGEQVAVDKANDIFNHSPKVNTNGRWR